jgi:hypothetical protein
MYPPFQVPCAIVGAAFVAGYLGEAAARDGLRRLRGALYTLLGAAGVAAVCASLFVVTRREAIQAIVETVYPGARRVLGGGYSIVQLLSGHLMYGLQLGRNMPAYLVPEQGVTNQSEASTFILLTPYVFVAGLWIIVRRYRADRTVDWLLALTSAAFLLLLVRLFAPWFDAPSALLGLDRVPHGRLMIGVGLACVLHTAVVVQRIAADRRLVWGMTPAVVLAVLSCVVCGAVTWAVLARTPARLGVLAPLAATVPIPLATFLILRGRPSLAGAMVLAFSFMSAGAVHPLYVGLEVLTRTPLSLTIRELAATDRGRWIADGLLLEHVASLNGAPSLSGVYVYPQPPVWTGVAVDGPAVWNRYAHVSFDVEASPGRSGPASAVLDGVDRVSVKLDPCGAFVRRHNVRFLVTEATDLASLSCLRVAARVQYPARTIVIYRVE